MAEFCDCASIMVCFICFVVCQWETVIFMRSPTISHKVHQVWDGVYTTCQHGSL